MNNIDCSDIENNFNDNNPFTALSQISKHLIYDLHIQYIYRIFP